MRPSRHTIKFKPVAENCPFCQQKTTPDYKEVSLLSRYMSERGKILSKARTGLCSKHQRMLTGEIKKARIVALLPFVVRA